MHLQLLASLALALPFATASYDSLGCYSKVAGVTDLEQYTYQSRGYCVEKCAGDGYAIAALKDGATCGCSNSTPASSAKIADDNCDQYCPGYPSDKCGGVNVYTVLTTEFYHGSDDDDSESDATQTASLHTTDGGIFVAATPNPSPVATTVQTVASKGITSLPSASKSAVVSAAITSASSSSSPSATPNAADSLHVGPVAGVLLAGLGLLL
ncbi:hypothetical protein N7488_005312 [Penicillium malachiteum]|nr:hypothetical protein N7488_005312 [Penicillium malachiteum]